MTNHDEATTHVLLQDGAGTHYLLTPELLAQARISEEVFAELTSADADDTGGFFFKFGDSFQSQFAGQTQNNTAQGTNVAIGRRPWDGTVFEVTAVGGPVASRR